MSDLLNEFNPLEFHHLYYGIIAFIISLFMHGFWHYFLLMSGVYMIADDICQHSGGLHALFVYLWGLTGWKWPGD